LRIEEQYFHTPDSQLNFIMKCK